MSREHTILLLECPGCNVARDLAAALARTPGVTRVYADAATEAVFVEHDSAEITRAELTRIGQRFGPCVCSRGGSV